MKNADKVFQYKIDAGFCNKDGAKKIWLPNIILQQTSILYFQAPVHP